MYACCTLGDGVSLCSQRCAVMARESANASHSSMPCVVFLSAAPLRLLGIEALASGDLRYFSFRAVAGARNESSRPESTEKIAAPTRHKNRLPVCVISRCRGTHAVITAAGVLVTYGEAARHVRGPRKAARSRATHQGQHL